MSPSEQSALAAIAQVFGACALAWLVIVIVDSWNTRRRK